MTFKATLDLRWDVVGACYVGHCREPRVAGSAYCALHEMRWIAAGNAPTRTVTGDLSYPKWRDAYDVLLEREKAVGSHGTD